MAINNYQFEIENYLERMKSNPYIDELKESLKEQQIDSIKKYLDDESINYLKIDTLKTIFKKCPTEIILKNFIKMIQPEFNKLITIEDKLNLINLTLKDFNETTNSSKNMIDPTELRISTITVCGNLSTIIDTTNIYNNFVVPPNDKIIGIIGCKANNYPLKGFFKKKKVANFFNSATLNVKITEDKCINFKIFKNGKIQLTGVPSETYAKEAINIVIDYIKSFSNTKTEIIEDITKIKLTEYRTVLINSDYFCGTKLKREYLYKLLSNKYNLSVNYDSENYPGVKLQYFWEKKNVGTEMEGICQCTPKCIGKGDGLTENNCKKITISTFQSGKIIITGGRNLEQINNAYKFFNKILTKNYSNIAKETTNSKIIFNKDCKYYFLKKKNITNYQVYDSLV
jgi:TATA-box binding protein (TBP) (component of TFIID and TFIIIB)